MCDASRMRKACGILWDKLGYIWDKRCNGLFILITCTTYAVARVWSGFCLRQHGTSHPVCSVFPRRARKNRTPTNISTAVSELGCPLGQGLPQAKGTDRISCAIYTSNLAGALTTI